MVPHGYLIRELILKELKMRYSRPLFGYLWALLSPLLHVAVFYLIFVLFLKVRMDEAPFVLYLMTAVFPWRMFNETLTASTTSLVDSKNLLREANFPHYVVPLSIALAALINFLPSLFIIVAVSAVLLKGLPWFIVLLPLIMAVQLLLGVGLSIICSIVYVRWRDLKHLLDPVLTLLFYLIPGVYSLGLVKDTVPSHVYAVYLFNPWVGLVTLYRIATLKGFYPRIGGIIPWAPLFIVPLFLSLITFAVALVVYKRSRYWINDYLSY